MKKIFIIAFIVFSASMTKLYSQEIKKDTCINKDLFIECEGKRMELEAKCLVAYQNCDIEKHNRKQADRLNLFSWIVTGFVIINTIIYINNK